MTLVNHVHPIPSKTVEQVGLAEHPAKKPRLAADDGGGPVKVCVKRYGLQGAARFRIPNHTRGEKHAPELCGELTVDRDGTRDLGRRRCRAGRARLGFGILSMQRSRRHDFVC